MALPSSLLAHLTFLPTPSADFLPTLYETTASTILAFLSLSPGSEANATTWAGAADGYWQSALVNHPAFLGFGGGFLGGLCFAFRVLAYICIGPFAFLILLVSPHGRAGRVRLTGAGRAAVDDGDPPRA